MRLLYARQRPRLHIDKLDYKIEIINGEKRALIRGWSKKKLVFAHALLPFGTVGVANAQIAHLVFADTQATPEKPKELFFILRSC